MPIAERRADVVWNGSLAAGSGMLESGSGAFTRLPVTWAARTEAPQGKTSPEELIAAAHATCFTMALALVLAEAGTPPERIATGATCLLDEVDGAPRITRVSLTTRAQVPAIDASAFEDAVAKAATLCPVSNALSGNVQVGVDASLDGSA